MVRTVQFCRSTNEVETCLKSGFPLTAFMSQPIHFAGEYRVSLVRFRLSDAPPHAHSLCDPLLKPKRSDRNGKLANHQDRPSSFRWIQINPQ